MPIDDETRRELDAIRSELRDELRSATSSRERDVVRGEARADLEDVLRREGYRLSRRELDEIMTQRDEDRITAAVDRRLAEIEAERREAEEGEEEEGDDDGDGKKKTPAAKKPPTKKPAGAGAGSEEEEWV